MFKELERDPFGNATIHLIYKYLSKSTFKKLLKLLLLLIVLLKQKAKSQKKGFIKKVKTKAIRDVIRTKVSM